MPILACSAEEDSFQIRMLEHHYRVHKPALSDRTWCVAAVKRVGGGSLSAGGNRAWYDVPSEDENALPEADSLASIISHHGASSDEEGLYQCWWVTFSHGGFDPTHTMINAGLYIIVLFTYVHT